MYFGIVQLGELNMTTPAKIALGVFLTLVVLCQLGTFDHWFNAFFQARALADEDWLTRMMYPLFAPENLVSGTRSENPIGFAVMAAIPCFGIAFVAYVFLMGMRAISKIGDAETSEQSDISQIPSEP